jgi:glucosamine--fructose-6-phosphate aminotransferase (isomerizing)
MFLLSQVLCGALVGDDEVAGRLQGLPSTLDMLMGINGGLAQRVGETGTIKRFFFLGGGALYGVACEAMLKIKEMTCSWAEAYHPLEMRHGPMYAVDSASLVVCFASDSQVEQEVGILREARKRGAKTMVLAETPDGADWGEIEYVLPLQSGLDEWDRPAIYLPLMHWMGLHKALAMGFDPDRLIHHPAVGSEVAAESGTRG